MSILLCFSKKGIETDLQARGRHDPCVLARAVPIVEAMVALVLADSLMTHTAQCKLIPGNFNGSQNCNDREDQSTKNASPKINFLGPKIFAKQND